MFADGTLRSSIALPITFVCVWVGGSRLQCRTSPSRSFSLPVRESPLQAKACIISLMEREFDVELYLGEDGWWVVECPSIPGCVSQGNTEDEALENIKDAIKGCLEVRRELGLPETVIRRKVTVAA